MKIAVLLLALLFTLGYAQKCTEPKVVEGFCGNKLSCCSAQEQSSFALSMTFLLSRDTAPACYDTLVLNLCAPCSPDPNHFTNGTEVVVCKSFCQRFYDNCNGVKTIGGEFIVPENMTRAECDSYPETNCYAGAGLQVIAFSVVIFAALAALIMF